MPDQADNSGGGGNAPTAQFNIRTDEWLEDVINECMHDWFHHPYTQDEVRAFLYDMDEWRANAKVTAHGNVAVDDGKGGQAFHHTMEIPPSLDTYFIGRLGRDYIRDPRIFKAIKRLFKIGQLNPNRTRK